MTPSGTPLTDADRLVERARSLRLLGRPAEALATVEQAVATDPGALAPRLERAVTLLVLRRWDDAVPEARRALALAPDDVAARLVLARALTGAGRARAAEEAARRCIALAAEASSGYDALAEALLLRGRTAEAEVAARQAVRLDPAQADWHDTLGRVLLAQGCLDAAEYVLREALRLDPASTVARNNLGVVLLRRDRPEEAVALFRSAAVDDPQRELYRHNVVHAARQHVRAPHSQLSKAFRLTTLPLVVHVTGIVAIVLLPFVLVARRRRFRQLPAGLQDALRQHRRLRTRRLLLRPWRFVSEDIAHFWPRLVDAVRARDARTALLMTFGILASLLWGLLVVILALFLVGMAVQGAIFLLRLLLA